MPEMTLDEVKGGELGTPCNRHHLTRSRQGRDGLWYCVLDLLAEDIERVRKSLWGGWDA